MVVVVVRIGIMRDHASELDRSAELRIGFRDRPGRCGEELRKVRTDRCGYQWGYLTMFKMYPLDFQCEWLPGGQPNHSIIQLVSW